MTPPSRESLVIAQVAEDYRRRDYEVDVAPRGPGVPEFLGRFQPDLIARSPTESVVVKVQIGARTSIAERFGEIAECVSRQPGWRFSLVFVNPNDPEEITQAEPDALPVLRERLGKAEALAQEGHTEAAVLLFFSAFEGILRGLGQRAHLPLESLPPSVLIRELYSAGEIDGSRFDSLMRFLPIRERLAHGLRAQEAPDLEQLRLLGQALLAEAGSGDSLQPA